MFTVEVSRGEEDFVTARTRFYPGMVLLIVYPTLDERGSILIAPLCLPQPHVHSTHYKTKKQNQNAWRLMMIYLYNTTTFIRLRFVKA